MSDLINKDMRTPLSKIQHFGPARSGTGDHLRQRMSALASAPLAIFFLISIIALSGADFKTVRHYLGHSLVSILLVAFIGSVVVHMRIGIQIIINDYVHREGLKRVMLVANTCFSHIIGLSCIYAALKIGFSS